MTDDFTDEMFDEPKNRYASFIKSSPYDDENWVGAVTVCFSQPCHGWILLWITTTAYLQNSTIFLSDVFSPFLDLIKWLEAISEGQLPAAMEIYEEGPAKTLRAYPAANGLLDFQILDNYLEDEEENIIFRTRVAPRQLISEFVFKLELLVEKYYRPEEFHYAPDLRKLDLSKLRQYLES